MGRRRMGTRRRAATLWTPAGLTGGPNNPRPAAAEGAPGGSSQNILAARHPAQHGSILLDTYLLSRPGVCRARLLW